MISESLRFTKKGFDLENCDDLRETVVELGILGAIGLLLLFVASLAVPNAICFYEGCCKHFVAIIGKLIEPEVGKRR